MVKEKMREAVESDIRNMVDLEKESMGPVRVKSEVKSDWEEIEAFLRERSDKDIFYLVERYGELLGYVHAVVYKDVVSGKRVCEIYTLTIHPEHFGEGLGGMLLEKVREEAKDHDVDILKLEVQSKNQNAITFYENKRFSEKKKILIKDVDKDQEVMKSGDQKKNNLKEEG